MIQLSLFTDLSDYGYFERMEIGFAFVINDDAPDVSNEVINLIGLELVRMKLLLIFLALFCAVTAQAEICETCLGETCIEAPCPNPIGHKTVTLENAEVLNCYNPCTGENPESNTMCTVNCLKADVAIPVDACQMAPCYSNPAKNYDFDLVPFGKEGHILVDCSCLKNPPKKPFQLGAYMHVCSEKLPKEMVQPIRCQDFKFKVTEQK